MPTKDPEKKAAANRERQRRYRERHQGKVAEGSKAESKPSNTQVTPSKTPGSVTPVTQADYDNLPPSLKFQVEAGTRLRQTLHAPLEIEERKALAVRRFRGY